MAALIGSATGAEDIAATGDVFNVKLKHAPTFISMQAAFSKNKVTVRTGENEVTLLAGGKRPILTLKYTAILKWVIIESGVLEIVYDDTKKKLFKVVVSSEDPEIVKEIVKSIEGHVAELMVFRGRAKTVQEARKSMVPVLLDRGAYDLGLEVGVSTDDSAVKEAVKEETEGPPAPARRGSDVDKKKTRHNTVF